MKITIIQIGKTRQHFVQEAEHEYCKRLQPYSKIDTITLKEITTPSGTSQTGQQLVKTREAEQILAHIPKNSFVIALTEKGKTMNSLQFAEFIKQKQDFGPPSLVFIIGGPYGLAPAVIQKAHLLLAFSAFTFTHEIIRIVLLEQIYRAFTILKGKTYHYQE